MASKKVRVLNDFTIGEISACSLPVQKGATARLIKSQRGMVMTQEQLIQKAVQDYLDNDPTLQATADANDVAAIEKAFTDLNEGEQEYIRAVGESENLTDDEKKQLAGEFLTADPETREAVTQDLLGEYEDDGGGEYEPTREDMRAAAQELADEEGYEMPGGGNEYINDGGYEGGGYDGSEGIMKSLHMTALERQIAELSQRAEASEYEADIRKSAEAIEQAYPNLPGTGYEKALVFKAIDSGIDDPHVRKYLHTMLAGADQAYGMANVPAGAMEVLEKSADDGGQTDLQTAINDLVKSNSKE